MDIINAKICISGNGNIGYFLQNSSNWMKFYTIKFKLVKFNLEIPHIIH
jgi:hypothetical protein